MALKDSVLEVAGLRGCQPRPARRSNIGALIIAIWLWGILYYT